MLVARLSDDQRDTFERRLIGQGRGAHAEQHGGAEPSSNQNREKKLICRAVPPG